MTIAVGSHAQPFAKQRLDGIQNLFHRPPRALTTKSKQTLSPRHTIFSGAAASDDRRNACEVAGDRALVALEARANYVIECATRRAAAGVAELVDALDLGSSDASRGGSNPSARTKATGGEGGAPEGREARLACLVRKPCLAEHPIG